MYSMLPTLIRVCVYAPQHSYTRVSAEMRLCGNESNFVGASWLLRLPSWCSLHHWRYIATQGRAEHTSAQSDQCKGSFVLERHRQVPIHQFIFSWTTLTFAAVPVDVSATNPPSSQPSRGRLDHCPSTVQRC